MADDLVGPMLVSALERIDVLVKLVDNQQEQIDLLKSAQEHTLSALVELTMISMGGGARR